MPCRVSLPRGPWNKCGKEPLNNQEPTFFREDDIFAHVYLTPTYKARFKDTIKLRDIIIKDKEFYFILDDGTQAKISYVPNS